MLHENTLNEIRESHLNCIEYEIGMFLCLLTQEDERNAVIDAIYSRNDYNTILEIANSANKESILNILSYAGMSFDDVSFESQNAIAQRLFPSHMTDERTDARAREEACLHRLSRASRRKTKSKHG